MPQLHTDRNDKAEGNSDLKHSPPKSILKLRSALATQENGAECNPEQQSKITFRSGVQFEDD